MQLARSITVKGLVKVKDTILQQALQKIVLIVESPK